MKLDQWCRPAQKSHRSVQWKRVLNMCKPSQNGWPHSHMAEPISDSHKNDLAGMTPPILMTHAAHDPTHWPMTHAIDEEPISPLQNDPLSLGQALWYPSHPNPSYREIRKLLSVAPPGQVYDNHYIASDYLSDWIASFHINSGLWINLSAMSNRAVYAWLLAHCLEHQS